MRKSSTARCASWCSLTRCRWTAPTPSAESALWRSPQRQLFLLLSFLLLLPTNILCSFPPFQIPSWLCSSSFCQWRLTLRLLFFSFAAAAAAAVPRLSFIWRVFPWMENACFALTFTQPRLLLQPQLLLLLLLQLLRLLAHYSNPIGSGIESLDYYYFLCTSTLAALYVERPLPLGFRQSHSRLTPGWRPKPKLSFRMRSRNGKMTPPQP